MGKKVIVILPAYNAARTLERTLQELPPGGADEVILVDDASRDNTVALARQLGLVVLVHPRNRGYGGNQKTCYAEALRRGADVVLMLHPDYQYDPALAPAMVAPILRGEADLVLGSRMLEDKALLGKMPLWRYAGNKFLTGLENWVFGTHLSEMHTGYRAFSRELLLTVPFETNNEKFVFDQEILAQAILSGARIHEIPIPTKYFKEASSVSFRASVVYGLRTLGLLVKFRLHTSGMRASPQFSLRQTAP